MIIITITILLLLIMIMIILIIIIIIILAIILIMILILIILIILILMIMIILLIIYYYSSDDNKVEPCHVEACRPETWSCNLFCGQRAASVNLSILVLYSHISPVRRQCAQHYSGSVVVETLNIHWCHTGGFCNNPNGTSLPNSSFLSVVGLSRYFRFLPMLMTMSSWRLVVSLVVIIMISVLSSLNFNQLLVIHVLMSLMQASTCDMAVCLDIESHGLNDI